jgi:hypothetical protein
MSITPLFLLSLPRSGSTFAQRLLGGHAAIGTSSEPWLLLPLLYALREQGCYAEYGHYLAVSGLQDFIKQLPEADGDYQEALRDMTLALYDKAAGQDARYFLDKTPRYHLVVDEIFKLYPDGRFIFLWRNPLAVIASIVESFGNGRWILYVLKVDLYDGLSRLVDAWRQYQDRAIAVNYESLVRRPERELQRVCDYLQLDYDASLPEGLVETRLQGRLGDQAGVQAYATISQLPLEKWKRVLNNPLRKFWCRRYLKWIGAERLASMGYDLDELLSQLDAVPIKAQHLLSDVLHGMFAIVYAWLEPAILRDKLRLLPRWWRIHGHR